MRKAVYPVANLADLTPDQAHVVPLGSDGGECALVLHDGQVYAVGSLCPHQNAPLNNAPVEDGCLVCNRHGYRFDLRSGDCVTLGGYGLPTFPVHLDGDTVCVSVWEFD